MTFLYALLLGLIEGITEFLPISSTGHLILAGDLLGLEQTEALKSFDIAIQLGAILAVVVLYGKRLIVSRQALLRVLAAFVPTAAIGFLAHDFVKTFLLESIPTVLWSLFIGGIVLIVFEALHSEKESAASTIETMSFKQAVAIGLFQAIAIVPGVSRAAATIVGGLLLGVRRAAIVEFSFLLAIPTMAAATGYDLLKTANQFSQSDLLNLGIGFIAAFVTATVAIRWLLRYIQHHSFTAFGWYRIGVAIVFAVGMMM